MIGVIYWSGTGNTEQMAHEVAEGIKAAGQDVEVKSVSEVSVDEAAAYEKLALGCADMGAEQLEEGEFEPFYTELEGKLSGKKLAIFGSYGWGGGTWLEDWGARIKDAGGVLVADGVAILGEPDDDGKAQCQELGKTLANA
nr:flavodoxin [Veillonella denticariosi]